MWWWVFFFSFFFFLELPRTVVTKKKLQCKAEKVYKGFVWGRKKVPNSPYFETKRRSEVVIFRQWVLGGCQKKKSLKNFLLWWLTSGQIWLIPLVYDDDDSQSTHFTILERKKKKKKPPVVVVMMMLIQRGGTRLAHKTQIEYPSMKKFGQWWRVPRM